MTKVKYSTAIISILIFISFFMAAYLYPYFPQSVASHWNVNGQVDGYMPKFWGLFLMPLISIVMMVLFILLPKIDPLKKNIQKFQKYYDGFIVLIVLYLFYIYSLTIVWQAGFQFNMMRALAPAFGVLFIYIGIMLKHTKRNWFIGIRTPWTMSNDTVWKKTHELGAKLFIASGILSLFGILFPYQAILLVLAPIIISCIYIIIYSYMEFKRIEKK
ncbi:MAG: SdpI family protein [Patescibacteria group bacterium]